VKYNQKIDGLRGILAIAVILFHWKHLLPIGWIAVEVFFVLSAYLVTRILLNAKSKELDFLCFYTNFIRRRVRRLVPLYFLFIAGCLCYYLFNDVKIVRGSAFYLLSYTVNFGKMSTDFPVSWGIGHLWSLCVEWQFYLVYPFLVYYLRKALVYRFLVASIIAAPILRVVTHLTFRNLNPNITSEYFFGEVVYNAPWSHLDALGAGGLLAFAQVQRFVSSTSTTLKIGCLTFISSIVLIFYGVNTNKYSPLSLGFPIHLSFGYSFVWVYSLIAFGSMVLVAHTIRGTSWLGRLVNNKFLIKIGKISYGIYVFHAPIIGFVQEIPWIKRGSQISIPTLTGLLTVLSASILAASLSYEYYESKFADLKNK
jgi:peptidoglycan/LPS O-acetylase OafA/YrhL